MAKKDTEVVVNKLYPIVADCLKKNSRRFLDNIAKFINSRHTEIFAIAPYDRIYFNNTDKENLYNSLGLKEKDVEDILKECFFWDIDYTPQCAKEPYVQVLMCCIRYYIKNNDRKSAEVSTIYTCFSGKFYASLHSYFWKKFPPRENQAVMDYVVNNMLSEKYDLKKEGTVFGAIKKLSITWLDTYTRQLSSNSSDDDMGKLIQQLRDREKSFLKNIANLYFDAIANKSYMNYETDNIDAEEFRITDNDAAKAARITEAAIGIMTSQKVDVKLCDSAKVAPVRTDDIRQIIESILSNNENLPKMRRVINIMICDFMKEYPNKIIGGGDFIAYSIKAKPNTKNKLIIEFKTTITNWLEDTSIKYRNSNREATRNAFYRSLVMYIVLIVCKVANR